MDGPSFAKIIEDAIENRIGSINTMLPGQVVKVDVPAGKCDVQPLIKRKYGDERVVDLPVITGVPIGFYRANKSLISLPVKIGDMVELRFSQRSLDIWKSKGGSVDPLDPRKFHLSDCIAYPGMYPFSEPPEGASAEDVVIKNDVSTIIIKPSGEVQVTAENAIKLLSELIVLSGDGDALSLASKVMQNLEAMKAKFDGHTHPFTDVTPGGPVPSVTQATTTPFDAPVEVASTKVKAV